MGQDTQALGSGLQGRSFPRLFQVLDFRFRGQDTQRALLQTAEVLTKRKVIL